jgi:hypothetical protein
MWDFLVNEVSMEQAFSEYFRFPLIIIPPMLNTHLLSESATVAP